MGPFTWQKMAKWITQGMLQPDLLLERGDVCCWLPVWLAHIAAQVLLPEPSSPASPVPLHGVQSLHCDNGNHVCAAGWHVPCTKGPPVVCVTACQKPNRCMT